MWLFAAQYAVNSIAKGRQLVCKRRLFAVVLMVLDVFLLNVAIGECKMEYSTSL